MAVEEGMAASQQLFFSFRSNNHNMKWVASNLPLYPLIRPIGVYQQWTYWTFIAMVTTINMWLQWFNGQDSVKFRHKKPPTGNHHVCLVGLDIVNHSKYTLYKPGLYI